MFTSTEPSRIVRRTLALATILGASAAMMSAQTSQATSEAAPDSAPSTLNLQLPPLPVHEQFSSSAEQNEVAVNTGHFDFLNAMQYGGGRRGRPRYRGGNTNADGSNKYTFEAGVGFTQPIGNTYHYLKPSYGFQVGGGRNFNKNVGLLVQFDYDNFGFNGRTLGNQSNVYNTVFGAGAVSGLDGSSHVWSFTLNPVYTLYSGEGLGAYLVGGVGFYHKVADFTEPTAGLCYDYLYGYYQCAANQTIDKYTSNAPGFNGGFGLTYKFSKFSSERLFGEIRYVFVDNQHRQGITVATAAPTASQQAATNFFPANSNRTTYFPVKFGIRF